MSVSEQLLTKDQLATRLTATKRSIDRWEEQGMLPDGLKVVIGERCPRYRETVLNEWIKAGCPGLADPEPAAETSLNG